MMFINVLVISILLYSSSVAGLFDKRIIYFQEVQRRFGDENKLIQLAQPPILYDSIIYESTLDLLFVLTKKSIMKFSGSKFKLLETKSMFSSTSGDQCRKFKYLPQYSCHSMGYWASSTSKMIVRSSAGQSANKKLFICYNNGTAIFVDMQNIKTNVDPPSRCFPDSILNIASQDNSMYGIVLNSAPIFIRYHPKYPKDLIEKTRINLLTLSDSNWLQQDDYIEVIKIFESDSHVYLVFKEVAEEVKTYCNKKVVRSRIGRVDKTDEGGTKFQLKENWVTFVKATITCPLVSYDKSVSHLNYVEDAYYDVSQKMIYATFSSSEISAHQTAACSYTLISVDAVLDGPYYSKNNPIKPVSTEETDCQHNRFDCKVIKARRYQLKFNKILTKENLIQSPQEIWTKIVSMTQERSSNQYTIVFIATNQFQIHKFYKKSTDSKLCYSETLNLSNNQYKSSAATINKIVDLKIINSRNSIQPFLVVSTTEAIFKVSIENCRLYITKETCQDILCFWSSVNSRCSTIYTIPVYELRSLPEMPKCTETKPKSPTLQTKTEWSMWEQCGSTENRCMCRQRKCKPGMCVNNRLGNTNLEFQVFNCTKLHDWSDWSAWSSCSVDCGIGVKSRKRWCFPRKGLCKGGNMEKQVCKAKVACKDAENQKPGPWTECSNLCGPGGVSYRRKCQDDTRDECNFLEWKNCIGTKCGKTEKLSDSVLLKSQNGISSYYTALCLSNKPNDNSLVVSVNSEVQKYSEIENKVSSCWTEWSNCSNCNPDRSVVENPSNSRRRNRSCLISGIQGAHHLCYGVYEESEDCGELCGYKINEGSFGMGLNSKFELVYILITGVVSFAFSLIFALIIFCVVKKNQIVTTSTSKLSNNVDSDKHSANQSIFPSSAQSMPRNYKQNSPLQSHTPINYQSYSPGPSPSVEATTGFFGDKNYSTMQRIQLMHQQRSTPPQNPSLLLTLPLTEPLPNEYYQSNYNNDNNNAEEI